MMALALFAGVGSSAKMDCLTKRTQLRGREAAHPLTPFAARLSLSNNQKSNAVVARPVEPGAPLGSDCLEAGDHRDGRRPLRKGCGGGGAHFCAVV